MNAHFVRRAGPIVVILALPMLVTGCIFEKSVDMPKPSKPAPSVLYYVDPSGEPSAQPVASTVPAASAPAAERFFVIGNDGGVMPGATAPTKFTLDESWHLVALVTYHYIYPDGINHVGQVGLIGPGGKVYGPWQAAGTIGQGDIPNAYWTAVTDEVLPAGDYQVTDSEPATWSQNGDSGGAGMAWGMGYPAP